MYETLYSAEVIVAVISNAVDGSLVGYAICHTYRLNIAIVHYGHRYKLTTYTAVYLTVALAVVAYTTHDALFEVLCSTKDYTDVVFELIGS